MPTSELAIEIRARDFATRVFRTLRGSLRQLGRAGARVFQGLRSQVFNLRNALIGGLGAGIVKISADFETGIATVATLVDTTQVNISALADGVKEIARTSGDSFDSLNKALFDTVSAGVEAGDALKFLESASRLAVGGVTSTASAVKGIVSIINAYGLEASDAAKISDQLFAAQKQGITTVELLSNNVGKLAPTARQAGLGTAELLAAVADLTSAGISTEEAITAVRSALSSLISPTKDSEAAAQELGIQWNLAALEAKGLVGFVQQLANVNATAAQQAALTNNNVRAFTAVATLARDGARGLADTLEAVTNSAGSVDEAFSKIEQTVTFQFAQLRREFEVVAIELGEALKPLTEDAITGLREFAQLIRANQTEIAAYAEAVLRSLGRVAEFIKNGLVGAFKFIRTALESDDPFKVLVDLARTALELTLNLFVKAVPLFGRVGLTIGKGIARGIVTSLIGTTTEEIGRALNSASSVGAFGLTKLFEQLGIPQQEVNRVRQTVAQLDALNAAIERAQRTNETLFGGRGTITNVRLDDINIPLQDALERRDELVRSLQGQRDLGAELFKADVAALQESANTFVREAGRTVENAVKTFSERQPGAVGEAFLNIFQGDTTQKLFTDISNFFGAARTKIAEEARRGAGAEFVEFATQVGSSLLRPFEIVGEAAAGLGRNAGAAFQQGVTQGVESEAPKTTRTLADAIKEFRSVEQQGISDTNLIISSGVADFASRIGETNRNIAQSFKDLTTSILQQLSSLLLTRGLTSLLSGIFPAPSTAANGAVFQGGFQAFANGSPNVSRPTLGLIGEGSRAEAVVPLPDNRSIPVKLSGNTGGNNTFVLQATVTSLDPRDAARVLIAQKDTILGIYANGLRNNIPYRQSVS